MTDATDQDWDDPDRAVQVEDDDPERLAGDDVEFDPEADGQEDLRATDEGSPAAVANLPAEGA